jgi:hypothetical protein
MDMNILAIYAQRSQLVNYSDGKYLIHCFIQPSVDSTIVDLQAPPPEIPAESPARNARDGPNYLN